MNNRALARELVALAGKLVEGDSRFPGSKGYEATLAKELASVIEQDQDSDLGDYVEVLDNKITLGFEVSEEEAEDWPPHLRPYKALYSLVVREVKRPGPKAKLADAETGVTVQHLRSIEEKYAAAADEAVEILQGAGVDYEVAREMLKPIREAVKHAAKTLMK